MAALIILYCVVCTQIGREQDTREGRQDESKEAQGRGQCEPGCPACFPPSLLDESTRRHAGQPQPGRLSLAMTRLSVIAATACVCVSLAARSPRPIGMRQLSPPSLVPCVPNVLGCPPAVATDGAGPLGWLAQAPEGHTTGHRKSSFKSVIDSTCCRRIDVVGHSWS